MFPQPNAGAPAPSAPSPLASAPGQSSALGGAPAGMSGSTDPRQTLRKAELLMQSGAISRAQYEMILAKLMGPQPGHGAPPPAPGGAPAPAAATPQMPQSPGAY